MSGRSAYVRKEKTRTKDTPQPAQHQKEGSDHGSVKSPSIYGDFPIPSSSSTQPQHPGHLVPRSNTELSSAKTTRSDGSDDLAYARVRKPVVPVLDVSGIEKSSFRSLMDKRSEGVRKGLAKTFGKKKKNEEARPDSAITVRPASYEMDSGDYGFPDLPLNPRPKKTPSPDMQEYVRLGPPQGKLPPIPPGPQLRRWTGGGRAPQPWNKLRKDPELWDPNGDTLIFFGQETHPSQRPPPSFRISSHVLENTQSRFLITLLREGMVDDANSFSMPPSPVGSPGGHAPHFTIRGRSQPTPPVSDYGGSGFADGQISYEIYFPAPTSQNKNEALRHQVTTRNILALLYQASLVGVNLFQALCDLHERLEVYMPPDTDAAGMIIDYVLTKGIDDVRENPASAASLLAWSESQGVRWEEGWREAFVHSAGMYNRLEKCGDFRFVTPITKALLERASLDMEVRIQNCEDRLTLFDYSDMWPMMSSHPPPARSAFERLQKFFQQHYSSTHETWPPAARGDTEQWLTRDLVAQLQRDFGSLFDYLVNRDVYWDGSEERSGRKWNIIHSGNRAFEADSPDTPFTDILVAFDNRHKFPHIPHPYPLTPDSIPTRARENQFKSSKKLAKPDDRIAERRAALAYTESTNIYLLGSDFVANDLVEAFVRFEKGDRSGDIDPHAARRGRWILIYGILQTLASVSVDTPSLRYKGDVSYHLNPRLRGTPPWKGANRDAEEASHYISYCYTISETWHADHPVSIPKPLYLKSTAHSGAPSATESEVGSVRSPTWSSMTTRSGGKRAHRLTKDSDNSSYAGSAPGTEKVGDWPIRDHSRPKGSPPKEFAIKDFDDEKY